MKRGSARKRGEVMFWQALREALYDDMRGLPMGRLRLSDRQIEEIRIRVAHGETLHVLAAEFRVSKSTIGRYSSDVERIASSRRKVQAMGMAA